MMCKKERLRKELVGLGDGDSSVVDDHDEMRNVVKVWKAVLCIVDSALDGG